MISFSGEAWKYYDSEINRLNTFNSVNNRLTPEENQIIREIQVNELKQMLPFLQFDDMAEHWFNAAMKNCDILVNSYIYNKAYDDTKKKFNIDERKYCKSEDFYNPFYKGNEGSIPYNY